MPLLESEMPADPLFLFETWFREAEAAGAPQPEAVTLATADAHGAPSARMVLLKGVEDGAFLFYTNYASRKGRDLATDKRAALVFYWSVTRHQVRVSGTVRRLSRKMSQAYFATRPRGAQLSALASRQSRVVKSRDVLERAVLELAKSTRRRRRCHRIGVATRCARAGLSSGKVVRTACTTGCATCGRPEANGPSKGSLREAIAPFGHESLHRAPEKPPFGHEWLHRALALN